MLVSTTPASENVSSYVSRYFTEMPTSDFDRKSIPIASRHKKLRTRVKFSAASAKNFFETNFLFLPDTPPRFLTTSHNVFVMKNLKTPDEVCEYLRISRTLLWRLEKDGELLPYRFRGKVFFEQDDVDGFLDSKKVAVRTMPNPGNTHPGPKANRTETDLRKNSGNQSPGTKPRQQKPATNGVLAPTPISQRSNRAGYFAPVAFGTAVAEIDNRYQQGNHTGGDDQ